MSGRFIVFEGLQINRAKSAAQNASAWRCGKVVTMPDARMIGVTMRDHCAFYRAPGVDIKLSGRAIQPLRTGNDQV